MVAAAPECTVGTLAHIAVAAARLQGAVGLGDDLALEQRRPERCDRARVVDFERDRLELHCLAVHRTPPALPRAWGLGGAV